MRAAILEGERKFAIKDVPEPVLDAGEVLIKVECCGICGSDLPTYVVGVPAARPRVLRRHSQAGRGRDGMGDR